MGVKTVLKSGEYVATTSATRPYKSYKLDAINIELLLMGIFISVDNCILRIFSGVKVLITY